MITLIGAQVLKYKSIEDSSHVAIVSDVTVLVGKNESGKTAFLEALYKALPLEGGTPRFNFVFDYPKREYVRYQPKHLAKSYQRVVELSFRIEPGLVERINAEVFHGAPVVQSDHPFTWAADYGNTTTVGIPLDHAAVMAALKKPLAGVPQVDEIFEHASRLDDVILNIETRGLPSDSSLGTFANEWRNRFAAAADGFGMVDWHIWNTYLRELLPLFLYFDDYRLLDGKINLDTLKQREIARSLTDADKTALGLLELAGITLDELMGEEGYESSRAKLEAIGLTITEEVFKYWKQNEDSSGNPTLSVEFDIKADPVDQTPFNNGKNLYIRVKNLRHGVTVPFDQRSKGFIWFFSFMVWFSAVENRMETARKIILLLDEPGLNLHALAQADFLAYIDELSKSRQIIYTTHSPFMVRSDRLEKVRVVEDRVKEGTKVTEQLAGSSEDSIFPLQAALGYSIAQNLFIAKKNVLIEGPADLVLLQHMSTFLEQKGISGLEEGVFVPAGGLDKLATFVALLGANRLKLVILHDRASAPHQTLENLIHQKLIQRNHVLDFSMFRVPQNLETDIEDLFPESIYVDAFNAAYVKELKGNLLAASDLNPHPRIVERVNRWLKEKGLFLLKDGGFNHYRVAQSLLPRLNDTSLSAADVERFTKLFARLNSALN